MIIHLNKIPTEVPDGATVGEVLRAHNFPAADIAVAVDNKVVQRSAWDTTVLQPDARITVIRAVCGG